MRRVSLLIDDIRRSVESQLAVGGGGISDEEILAYLNSAQYQLYCAIVQKNPDLLLIDESIDIVANQESYDLPSDTHLGTSIRHVWYKYGSGDNDYMKLSQQDTATRRSDLLGDPAYYYERQGSTILLTPTPTLSITGGLRVTYQKQLRRLDIRRGLVDSVGKTSTTLNTVTCDLAPSLSKDSALPANGLRLLPNADYICIIDKSGAEVLNSIPIDSYDSTTGIITVSSGYTTVLTGVDLNGHYVVVGANSTDNCDFPDETVERYLFIYARMELLRRQGNPDEVANAIRELASIESNLIDSYETPDQDIKLAATDITWSGWGGGSFGSPNGVFGGSSGGGTVATPTITIENSGTEGHGLFKGLVSGVYYFFNINAASPLTVTFDSGADVYNFAIDFSLLSTLASIDSADLIPFYDVSGSANKAITYANFVATFLTSLGTTNHAVQVGNSTGGIASVAVGTTGQVLTGATGADPAFSNLGTNSGLTVHGVLLGQNNSAITATTAGTTGQVLIGSTGADPAFAALGVNSNLTANSLLLGQGNSAFTALGAATNGQIPIGSTGADPVLAAPTNGSNVTWTTGAGSLTANLSGTTDHSVQLGNSGGSLTSLSVGTNGQILVGGTAADPSWVTPTVDTGLTLTTNSTTLLYGLTIPVVVTSGGTGIITTTAYAPICGGTTATGAWQAASTGLSTSGYFLMSNGASAVPSWASVRIPYTEVTGTSQNAAVDNGYILNNAALVTLTLPSTAAVGTVIPVVGKGAGGWKVAQNASQVIHIGSADTTTGTGGSLNSTNRYDCVDLVCVTANTDFVVRNQQGNINYV
jgi:hypothetical protein